MKALILRSDADVAAMTARVFVENGFQISCIESPKLADALVHMDGFDILVMDEVIDDHLTHALALSAERRSPNIATILITDRDGAQTDDLFELLPSLHALLGHEMPAALIGQLACAAMNPDESYQVDAVSEDVARAASPDPAVTQWDGLDQVEQDDILDDDATINADIEELAARLPAGDPIGTATMFGPQQPCRNPAFGHIAHVSIIGEGRPVAVGVQ